LGEAFSEARDRVLDSIDSACKRAGRDSKSVGLVAVSKTVPPDRLVEAVAAGLTVLGENRVQEAESKKPLVQGARWHLIGPLQSNKARRAIELFDVIESVDSVDLAVRLDRLAGELGRGELPVYIQVNVDRDEAKAGFDPDDLSRRLPELAELRSLRLEGLMTVGRFVSSPELSRPTFAALRVLSERLRRDVPALGAGLSMGMSTDFPVAIEEGSTLVRVGRALFGDRAEGGLGR
jgi:PLP dependent protein